ncbi:FtsX-like permease family protein [Mucilaginibacter sp. R11]|uniref:FtsX-like permease family protein n=2 Tax=Mucilaginibacter agri TaxID=2695265 RepID=A0A965ZHX3_9SPHI|nr:FtsX-like permease family protein [Mucilaginibacter agri]
MAWRDSRKNRSRLFLFISAIIFGIAAIVAIYSFGYNVKKDVDNQAATLIGADLSITSNKPVDASMLQTLNTLGDRRSQERSFASMIYFPKGNGTRLVQVRALQGEFPYYGSLETTPITAGTDFKNGKKALVDQTLMLQFNAQVGDSIKVGSVTFLIAGTLNKAPGQTGISAGIAPIVYIPLQYLTETGLMQKGSRISYNYYYKYDHDVNVTKLIKGLEPKLEKANLNYDTIDTRKENTGRSFADLTKFLSLVGFIALLLGCVGVASAIHIYIREKIASIAIMRCLGVRSTQAFLIYLIQIISIGLIGSIIGAALGSLIQYLLPLVFKDFLPITVTTDLSWMAIGQGVLLGVIISVLFALLPLIAIRNISPLNTLRMSYESVNLLRDPLRWLVYVLIVGFIVVFSYFQLDSWPASIAFTIGIFIAFLILTLIAKLLMWLAKLLISNSWSYLWRQGFANLYRPNNQTIILMVSIGLSTAFICTLFFIQSMLVRQVSVSATTNTANMILFDIQPTQKQPLAGLTTQYHLPVIQQVPVVTTRINTINGKNAAQVKKDTTIQVSPHVFANEYRVTYRDTLTPTEKVIDGEWQGKAKDGAEVPVSIEDRFAKRNHLKIGDHIEFNVQGSPVKTLVTSIRTVNWNKMQTNFLVVFPAGVLEDAPQFYAMLTHVPSKEVSAKYQQAVVKQYPNVSLIDLGQVLSILDELLDKLGDIIKFMSGFSIITGIVVLIASVRISKYQRIQESVLLRTMGASRRQILVISALEYLFLGALSALTGTLIAFAGSWLLAKFSFDIPFSADVLPAGGIFLAITLLTITIGLLNSRGILNKPPLEILRGDV